MDYFPLLCDLNEYHLLKITGDIKSTNSCYKCFVATVADPYPRPAHNHLEPVNFEGFSLRLVGLAV